MKFCSFDIETATITPDNADPHKFRPLGICVAATQLVDTDLGVLGIQPAIAWHEPVIDQDSPIGAKMSMTNICSMISYLEVSDYHGFIPLTWNGLGFDFDILAEESLDHSFGAACASLALRHYDPAFQMLCSKGFMIGMQAAALGLGLSGKSEGMHGDLAPKLWAESRSAQDKVIAYVKQDVQTTSEIAMRLLETKMLPWISQKGRPNKWPVETLLNVQESLALPLPDTSWMSEPRTRESCYAWTKKYLKEE